MFLYEGLIYLKLPILVTYPLAFRITSGGNGNNYDIQNNQLANHVDKEILRTVFAFPLMRERVVPHRARL